jgi:tetratricopeptide (TPR) repeat protein
MKYIRILFFIVFIGVAFHLSATKKSIVKNISEITPIDIQFNYYYDAAIRERIAGRYDAAVDLLNTCNRIKPDDGNVMYEWSKIYVVAKQTSNAIVCLEKASVAQPNNVWFKTALAEQYIAGQKIDKAVETYNAIVKIDPKNDDALAMLISIYSQLEKYDEAIGALNQLEKLQGINQDITMEKARLYFLQHQNKKGIAEVDKLVKAYPNESKYQVLRGDIYLDQKMMKEAQACYHKVLETDSDNGEALYSLSKYYKAVGDTVNMMSTLDQMMRNKNVDLEVKIAVLKDMATESSEIQKVATYLAPLLELYPEEESLHNYNFLLLMMHQNAKAAEDELHIMLDINPQNKTTWTRLIDMKVKQENFIAIDTLCRNALSYFEDDVDFYFYRSIALFQLGKYRETASICNKALKLVPDKNLVLLSQFYTQLGDTYYRLGLKDSTFMAYDQSLKYQPNNAGTLNNYAYYLSLEKKELKKAESMSAKTVNAEPTNATYLDTYAWIFFVEGNYSLSKIYEKQALDNGGDKNAEVLEHYGDILFLSGEKEQAVEWWQKAVDAGSTTELLKKKIAAKSYLSE